jgi:hypothetical protein
LLFGGRAFGLSNVGVGSLGVLYYFGVGSVGLVTFGACLLTFQV